MFGDPEAGTDPPPAETADGAAIEAGDDGSGSEGEGKEKKVTIDQKEYLALKVGREEEKAELARLRAERGQRTTTDTRGSEADEAREALKDREAELAEDREMLKEIEKAAASGNREAKAQLAVMRSNLRSAETVIASEQRTVYRLEMVDIPEAKRAAVKAKIAETPGLKSPALAYRLLKGDEHETLAQEVERLRKENDDLKKPAPKADRPIPGGSKAGAGSTKNGVETVPLSEYRARMNDPARVYETKKARDAGLLKVKND